MEKVSNLIAKPTTRTERSAVLLAAGSLFGHATFALLFFFGHIWHGARTLYRDVFAGIDPDLGEQVEFGLFQKLGDKSTRRLPEGYVPPTGSTPLS